MKLSPPKPYRIQSDTTKHAARPRSLERNPSRPFSATYATSPKPVDAGYDKYAALTDAEILKLLRQYGFQAGPLTDSTVRKICLDRLIAYERNNRTVFVQREQILKDEKFSFELERFANWDFDNKQVTELENDFMKVFFNVEGKHRSCVYLLLDPQIALDIPHDRELKDTAKLHLYFRIFLHSIFYIGQGGSLRPYSHFVEAKREYIAKKVATEKISPKHCRITSSWQNGYGPYCVRCFHDSSSPEAESREALMIDAVGLEKLTNQRSGTVQGSVNGWSSGEKRLLGSYFLYKAFRVFLTDGGRQILSKHV